MMKSLTTFVCRDFKLSAADVEAAVLDHQMAPLTSLSTISRGWHPTSPEGAMVFTQGNHFLLTHAEERKVLPASVVKELVAQMCVDYEKEKGFAPSKIVKREFKDAARTTLLQRAFTRMTLTPVWIDGDAGRIVVGASSVTKADDIVSALRSDLGITVEIPQTTHKPDHYMTKWIQASEAPAQFAFGDEFMICGPGEEKPTIKFSNHGTADARRLTVDNDYRVQKIGLEWKEEISFVLNKNLQLCKLKMLSVLAEPVENPADQFGADFALFTGQVSAMLTDLNGALA